MVKESLRETLHTTLQALHLSLFAGLRAIQKFIFPHLHEPIIKHDDSVTKGVKANSICTPTTVILKETFEGILIKLFSHGAAVVFQLSAL